MDGQAWFDEAQRITSAFVQRDDELGELMLDHGEPYWTNCFKNGLTPQQALDGFIEMLAHNDALAQYKLFKGK